MGYFINAVAFILDLVFNLAQLLIIASVIISWVNADPHNPIVRTIHSVTEPMFRPFRRISSKIPGNLDWSPLIVILVIVFLQKSLIPYMQDVSRNLTESGRDRVEERFEY